MTTFRKNSELDFGKFNGKTLQQVFKEKPGYIDWCMREVRFFEIEEDTIEELRAMLPGFEFSAEAIESNHQKINYIPDPPDPWEGYGRSYEIYEGGPTGYLSDDFINDVLDGDPDAYWNID